MIVNQRALLLAVAVAGTASAWTTQGVSCLSRQRRPLVALTPRYLAIEVPPENSSSSEEPAAVGDLTFDSEEQKKEVVGNLVADDEWEGLTLELTDLVRKSLVEDIKSNARDFLGKDDYQVGDITKEVDARVKDEVAKLRGKEEYELGDFVLAMDELSKKYTEELTGKPYEPGDLSTHLDTNIKASVAAFCGKDEYEVGDLTREISKRIESRVGEFTGKDGYEFGDITREIENRRKEWVKDYLGEDAAADYQFGDIARKALGQFTGKGEDYQFGDATKKVLGSLFGNKKK
uniref:Uncharacterized protein n=2 Tax=Amphora coffeiformis TaxID=265554 RepID=A0A7S3P3U5_9STRA